MTEAKDVANLIRDYFKNTTKYEYEPKDMKILDLQLKATILEKEIDKLKAKLKQAGVKS
tara:strand:+ start:322 stop:498 length:177 start_codon:yes stop_codon:yes gene_type:complete